MDPIEQTARFLQRRGLRLATAESCTAGLIASHIADVPGCGSTLQCAVVAYSPEAKKQILGVSAALIERHGLTSEAVSLAMAHGVMAISHANVAVANTGVADDGAPDGTPPGTQCFAWLIRLPGRAALAHTFTETRRFRGNRTDIRQAASAWALQRIPHYYALATSTSQSPDAKTNLTDMQEPIMTSSSGTPRGQTAPDENPQTPTPETIEVKVSGEGNGLVDDETSGNMALPDPGKPVGSHKTANEANGGEGDEDATSQ
ncbi:MULTISPECIES: CinA family protein [Cupriavidus]|uniref:CinA, C-terminal n=1 Tax=Cupriavidus pinatubonensis (strain JMP 134 / LMG 1197) TaxID=264198 RepID=Q475E3_CUPPJ|nr:CinA family protein [Cupriavidus pinatubonensis]QYY32203.1 CinA family protein [Cupriavidus pinatubonensis]TPQ36695.1 CinA family protein [Cupriavidus pinatubonensis]